VEKLCLEMRLGALSRREAGKGAGCDGAQPEIIKSAIPAAKRHRLDRANIKTSANRVPKHCRSSFAWVYEVLPQF
jgi:hypothetical protein